MAPFITTSLRPRLHALAATFVPEIASAGSVEWAMLEQTVERALAARPAVLRRQLALLIRVLDLAARLRHGVGLAALDPPRRAAFLERLAASPIKLLRRGLWGLRTLVMLGW